MKDSINTIKTQSIYWEKIFSKYLSVKELVSNTYKELLKLSNKKTSNTIKNGQNI